MPNESGAQAMLSHPISEGPNEMPQWDDEQLKVIEDDPGSWQLVVAGAGCGKSAVACQRVARLVDLGLVPSKILLVSFTRTAVAELRDRIVLYAVAGEEARSVRISTIDSNAWSLRVGFDEDEWPQKLGDKGYDLNIERVVQLFREGNPDLIDFMRSLEHLIIDEAQDVVGIRAELIMHMLGALGETCGVTILGDPVQAIYAFTTDEDESNGSATHLMDLLAHRPPRPFSQRYLGKIHRIQDDRLIEVFHSSRRMAEEEREPEAYVGKIVEAIRQSCADAHGKLTYAQISELLSRTEDESVLALFRRRADVLIVSSYCSGAGLDHRLRLSGLPTVVVPWIGWLFAEFDRVSIEKRRFDALWEERAALSPMVFSDTSRDTAWALLHRMAAARRPNALALEDLQRLISRPKPPVELCFPEVGDRGPILGTIHASKGREANTVLLVVPAKLDPREAASDQAVYEEGRVYYVGATRARRVLVAASLSSWHSGYLDSGRVYRTIYKKGSLPKVQLEIGREGDVDSLAHLTWENRVEIQSALASFVGKSIPLVAKAHAAYGYDRRLFAEFPSSSGVTEVIEVGQMSEAFDQELGRVWGIVDKKKRLRPATSIGNIYCVGITTVALTETERLGVPAPYNRSGFALTPVLKGFPSISFFSRNRK